MPTWVPPYLVRRSTRALSFAIKQNWMLLQMAGEACYLLKRKARANAPFQKESRVVATLTATAASNSYSADPDTGMLRYQLWNATDNSSKVYPDIGTLTATVQTSGGTSVWSSAVDKYSFIADEEEYAFDIYQDQLDSDGNEIVNSVYIVFNTSPFHATNIVHFTYGPINPLTNFDGMQPIRDNEPEHARSLFGFEQWKATDKKIRKRCSPNSFLLAFPGIKSDFTITDAGLLRETQGDFWTVPPPYSPAVVEHDVIIRQSTGQRFQVINYTPIYIEDILVSQHFDLVELDPRSSIYDLNFDPGC
jgi:hypothetical protein